MAIVILMFLTRSKPSRAQASFSEVMRLIGEDQLELAIETSLAAERVQGGELTVWFCCFGAEALAIYRRLLTARGIEAEG